MSPCLLAFFHLNSVSVSSLFLNVFLGAEVLNPLDKMKAPSGVWNVFPFSDTSQSAAVQRSSWSPEKARSPLVAPSCPCFTPF